MFGDAVAETTESAEIQGEGEIATNAAEEIEETADLTIQNRNCQNHW